jgi:hypothetical protein
MARSRSSGFLFLVSALVFGFVPGSAGRAADGGDNREREVYEALHQADLLAGQEARDAYPLIKEEGEVDATYLDDRVAFREERKRRGRDEVARRFGLLIDQVEAIGRRGDAEHWTLSDDPKPDHSSEAADRIALGVLALSLLVAFCGIVYCALFRRSLLVEAYTAVVIAWRRYVR